MAKNSIGREDGLPWKLGNGKVIGEFVCDYISPFRPKALLGDSEIVRKSCVKVSELIEYAPNKPFPKDHLYAWHISDLKIYDKPRELRGFYHTCNGLCIDTSIKYRCEKFTPNDVYACDHIKPLKRPPQSWCYVEEQR
jgi:hypothetical protein